VILEEPTSREDAENIGHLLIQLLKKPLQLEGHTVQIGASVGIAVFPDDGADMESLCVAADMRMYDNKHASAGRVDNTAAHISSPSTEAFQDEKLATS